ncbi:MAG TPA: PucR family transcriptional regulator ligand-binding domain-containing protein [Candidatus Eisenbacteria bacterium]|nr:PucR family transcriptional regulator ligand-binding domain-containing protein [Candidatus Eisenbacteria bacterium]
MKYNTSFTVSKLLGLQSMHGASVLAGEKGLINPIAMLNIMEVPDITDWVEKGDFLLTTAYSFKDNANDLTKLIDQLIEKKISGFGIKTKRYVEEIPEEAIRIANQANFPLIELPYEVSFSTILVESFTEIINTHASTLIRIDNIHKKLVNVMLGGGHLQEIAESIYKSIDKNAVAIKDMVFDNSIIFSEPEVRNYIKNSIDIETYKYRHNRKQMKNKKRSTQSIDLWGDLPVLRHEIPIYSGNMDYGYLYIWENVKELTLIERGVIESSSSLIALDIYKNLSIFESKSTQSNEFIEELLSGDSEKITEALKTAHLFDFQHHLSYTVLILSLKGLLNKKSDYFTDDNYMSSLKKKHLSIIHKIKTLCENKVISASKDNSIVILFSSKKNENPAELRQKISELNKGIADYFDASGYSEDYVLTVGRTYKQAQDLWKSYQEASRSITATHKVFERQVIFYDDLGVFRVLFYDDLKPELEKIMAEELKILVEYDHKKNTELVNTLQQYFECEGNLAQVAENLFIHYNTVVYRLNRIKEIMDIDFDNYNDRLNLQLALKINEIYPLSLDNF